MRVIRMALAAALISCISTDLFSQDVEASLMQQVSPLTANAASLGKYGDIPVSLYTGIPNISIPIHEIRVGSFTLPISLNYHAGGISVDDLSSWVGTGWTLNAGGVMNRRMRGVEDYRMVNSWDQYADEIQTILDPNVSPADLSGATSVLNNARYDTEADIFSISTGTLSHKFFLDVNGDAHGMPARRLQIVPESSVSFNQGNYVYYARWRVRDETGIEYIFGRTLDDPQRPQKDEFEVTRNESVCGAQSGSREYVNTWYLNEIRLPSGESIYFTYDYFSYCQQHQIGYYVSLDEPSGSNTSQLSTNYIKALRIKEIIYPTGKVEFVPSQEDRRDVPGDKVLEEIRIYTRRMGQDFHEKSFVLETNNPTAGSTPPNSFRLALLSVTEVDKDGNPLSPYKFEYNHSVLEANTLGLPARLSFAQDLWGYYNGKTSNWNLFPRYMYMNEWYGLISGTADRSVSPLLAQKGVLKKITYPTKATTEFFYESNVARGITAQDENLTWGNWSTTPEPFQNPMWDMVQMHATQTTTNFGNNVDVLNVNGTDLKYSQPFQIFPDGRNVTDVMVNSHIMYGANNDSCKVTSPEGVIGSFWECLDIVLEKKGDDGEFQNANNTVYFGRTYGLGRGTYRIKLAWKDPGLNQVGAYAYVNLSWTGPPVPSPVDVKDNTQFTVGGLRIAKIVDSDADTGKETIRWFDYEYDELDYETQGSLHAGTSGIIQNTLLRYTYGNIFTCFTNSSVLQTNGGLVGYKKVTVSYGADKKGGRKIHYFTTALDYPDGNLSANRQWSEQFESVEVDWRRGLLERVIEQKYEGGNYRSVKETRNYYRFLNSENDPDNFHHVNVRLSPAGQTGGVGARACTFKTISEAFLLEQSVETTIDQLNEVVVSTTFEQNPYNLAVSRAISIDSRGHQKEEAIKYPVDYDDVENINALMARNMISVPIKTETTYNGSLVSGVVVRYTDFGQPSSVYRYERENVVLPPVHSNTVIVPPGYQLRSEFSYGSGHNKLRQSRSGDGVSIVYVWGYENAFPVVRIENIEPSEITPSVFANIEAHTFTGSSSRLEFQTDIDFINAQVSDLRSNKKYRVTTYTYNTGFGLTSQTDPNGVTTYFERDSYGRLMLVRDKDGSIVTSYKYNYKSD